MNTLEEVQEYIRANREEGCKCPACDQNVKLYRRKLNSGCVRFLLALYRLSMRKHGNMDQRGWRYFTSDAIRKEAQLDSKGLDYGILRHWGLAEQKFNLDGKKRNAGEWKMTLNGCFFVLKQINVPSHVLLYNNECLGFSDEQTSIDKALNKNFNYQELLEY